MRIWAVQNVLFRYGGLENRKILYGLKILKMALLNLIYTLAVAVVIMKKDFGSYI